MSEMTPERVHRIARFASDGPDEFSAEVRDLARAYIAQAAELARLRARIDAADKLAEEMRAMKDGPWGISATGLDALSAYEKAAK